MINESIEWKTLEEHVKLINELHLKDLLQDEARCNSLVVEHNGIIMDYSRQNIQVETIDLLLQLASAAGLEKKRFALYNGEHINATEDRAVLHVALRAPVTKRIMVDGVDVIPDVHKVLNQIEIFSNKVRNNEWKGATGKPLTNIVSIGIGGSFLGPEFVYEALRTDSGASIASSGRTLRFLANVDPVDVSRALSNLDPETTLVIIVSKTFTTAETMLNARTVRDWLLNNLASKAESEVILRQHFIAVSTAISKATDFGISAENVFGFWDWVGGRFSVTSAVGLVPLSIHYGFDVVKEFLNGAHDMDTHFFESPLRNNLPILLGLLGVWNSSFLKHPAKAILPYSQALTRFAAHIQQMDMESNGKRVTVDGQILPFDAGEIIFGEPGTNGQHSFYQLIHQGRVIPSEFIAFCNSPSPIRGKGEPVSNHDELMSNFFAQPDALAVGKTVQDLILEKVPESLHRHKEFPGNRPSLSILFDSLTPFSLGQLLSLYEHRVAVQGFIWGLNSFDQWGVELGKVLANKVRTQLVESREKNSDIKGFNYSTTTLLKKYLQKSS